jgi:hypothetical protein
MGFRSDPIDSLYVNSGSDNIVVVHPFPQRSVGRRNDDEPLHILGSRSYGEIHVSRGRDSSRFGERGFVKALGEQFPIGIGHRFYLLPEVSYFFFLHAHIAFFCPSTRLRNRSITRRFDAPFHPDIPFL